MNITELPIEVGALIFTYLDTTSKINAYSVAQLRNFFMACFPRKLDLSRSTVASAKTLSLDGFHDIAMYIEELNLSGIRYLTADILSKYIKRCINLKTLDVTFTEIFLSDLDDICCDSLRSIGINYFPWTHLALLAICEEDEDDILNKNETWTKITNLFKKQKFEGVHFVVWDYDYFDLPLSFIDDVPMVKDLKITLAHNSNRLYDYDSNLIRQNYEGINFEKLSYVIRDCYIADLEITSNNLKGINLDYTKIEYMFMMCSKTLCIYVSPMICRIFNQLDCTDLSINVCSSLPNFELDGQIIFKAWNKDVTIFDEVFFKNLLVELSDYFPTYICMKSKQRWNIVESPSRWYCLDNCRFDGSCEILPEYVSLSDFCRSCSNERHNQTRSIALTPPINTFKNVTLLSISYGYAHWDHDFFVVLFMECKKLRTLDIATGKSQEGLDGSALPIFNSLHLPKSLQNLRILLKDLEIKTIFDSLCQCPSLKNVHIAQFKQDYELQYFTSEEQEKMSKLIPELNIPSVIERCSNLYNLFMQVDISTTTATYMLRRALRIAAQELGRDYLHIELCQCGEGRDQFADVFNPSPLQITH